MSMHGLEKAAAKPAVQDLADENKQVRVFDQNVVTQGNKCSGDLKQIEDRQRRRYAK